jgi:hypothetical protein
MFDAFYLPLFVLRFLHQRRNDVFSCSRCFCVYSVRTSVFILYCGGVGKGGEERVEVYVLLSCVNVV